MTWNEFDFSCSIFLQELIEVDSDVVFELASYILQVWWDLLFMCILVDVLSL